MKARQTEPVIEKHYSVTETALLLGFCNRWVLDHIHNGSFPGTFLSGTDYRIPASSINRWMEARRVKDAMKSANGTLIPHHTPVLSE